VEARVAPNLRDLAVGGHRVDAAAALDEILIDDGSLRRDEDFPLAHRSHEGRRHLDVAVLHRLLGSEAERDLFA